MSQMDKKKAQSHSPISPPPKREETSSHNVAMDSASNSACISKEQQNPAVSAIPSCGFTVERTLGKGVFGEVLLASSNGQYYALKKISKNAPKFDWRLVNREVEVGKRLRAHEGVIQLESYFETEDNVYLVFEYAEGKDLFSLMEAQDFNPVEEDLAKHMVSQIVDSLIFCHKNSVAHRDIKLDNIMYEENTGVTKLLDFGLASLDEVGEKGCSNFVGSPEYCPPEIIMRNPYSGYKADVYSLGMVLFCLLFGQFPFIPEQRFHALAKGIRYHPALEWPDKMLDLPHPISSEAKDLISKMLELDPEKRISMEQVAAHKWFHDTHDLTAEPNVLDPAIQQGIHVC